MSLMGPGDESAHYISVTRASDVMQHGINYHEGKIIQKLVLYRTDDAARLHLLDALGDAVESWLPDYNGHILDGSSWSLVVHYAGYKESKMFKGYGQTPPRADKIKRLILNLAEFETTPEIF